MMNKAQHRRRYAREHRVHARLGVGCESYEWEEGAVAYEWDSQNRLTKASMDWGTTIEYKYDAFGRRIGKKVNAGAWRKYFYDGLQVVAEGTGTNDKIYYTHAPSAVGGIVCRDNNGTKYWYHYDHLGNVVAVTDSDGNPVVSYAMEAFGGVVAVGQGDSFYNSASTVQPYYLTTKEWDSDVSLYYFNARWYDPGVGNFLSLDPEPKESPMSYTYAAGNPLSNADPSGESICCPGNCFIWIIIILGGGMLVCSCGDDKPKPRKLTWRELCVMKIEGENKNDGICLKPGDCVVCCRDNVKDDISADAFDKCNKACRATFPRR